MHCGCGCVRMCDTSLEPSRSPYERIFKLIWISCNFMQKTVDISCLMCKQTYISTKSFAWLTLRLFFTVQVSKRPFGADLCSKKHIFAICRRAAHACKYQNGEVSNLENKILYNRLLNNFFFPKFDTSPFCSIWLEISTNWHTKSQGPKKKWVNFTKGSIHPFPAQAACY